MTYDDELAAFPETFEWALRTDIRVLAECLQSTASSNLVAIGSGGSFTAALYASELHQRFTARLSEALTPLSAAALPFGQRDLSVLVLSARGQNPDVVGIANIVARLEPATMTALTLASSSRVTTMLRRYQFVNAIEYALPRRRDGFLSTNSLIAFLTLLRRAYSLAFSDSERLPPNFLSWTQKSIRIVGGESFVRAKTLLILHGATAKAGAYDLESKLSESSLCQSLVSDYRNFAHGRHFWLKQRHETSAVVAFLTEDDAHVAEPTLAVIAGTAPIVRVLIKGSSADASFLAVVAAMQLFGLLARVASINVSRPGVPPFGRRLYHLRGFKTDRRRDEVSVVAILRKIAATGVTSPSATTHVYASAFAEFRNKVNAAKIRCVVSDYDGTLAVTSERYEPLGDIVQTVLRLLKQGIVIGIATGRGMSVAAELRARIPKGLWERVLVGYYNGAMVRNLADAGREDGDKGAIDPILESVASALEADSRLQHLVDVRRNRFQISLRARSLAYVPAVWRIVTDVARGYSAELDVLQSSHSIDVVHRTTNKLSVVHSVASQYCLPIESILAIGDKGRWPGNDFRLLTVPLSISVDEVSPALQTCWSVAPRGMRGPQATQHLLRMLRVEGGSEAFRLELPR